MLGFAAATLLAATLDVALGWGSAALHFAPALLVLLPLLFGRFLGERLLARWLARAPAPRRSRVQRWRLPAGSVSLPRLLLAWELAVRPPPGRLAVVS